MLHRSLKHGMKSLLKNWKSDWNLVVVGKIVAPLTSKDQYSISIKQRYKLMLILSDYLFSYTL